MEYEDLDGDEFKPEKAAQYAIPEYAKFDTSVGDEYDPCSKLIEEEGVTVAISDIGKKATESICRVLRREGFKIDWHAVKNTVIVKALENEDRMTQLRSRWRALVKEYASRNLKVR
jgi:hypothetical protein